MRFLVPTFFALAALGSASIAQETATAKPAEQTSAAKPAEIKLAQATADANKTHKPAAAKATPAAATPAAATPAPKKPTFFNRVFGTGNKPKATPEPTTAKATPTPAPATPRPKPKPKKESAEEDGKPEGGTSEEKPGSEKTAAEAPAGTEKPAATTDEKPAENEAKPEDKEPAPAAAASGKKGHRKGATAEAKPKEAGKEMTKEQLAVQDAIATGDPNAIEKAKYNEVKVRASEDSHIKELKEKADNAPADEEGRKALRAYNRALFEKMRSLADKDVQERIDAMEKAVLKNIGE